MTLYGKPGKDLFFKCLAGRHWSQCGGGSHCVVQGMYYTFRIETQKAHIERLQRIVGRKKRVLARRHETVVHGPEPSWKVYDRNMICLPALHTAFLQEGQNILTLRLSSARPRLHAILIHNMYCIFLNMFRTVLYVAAVCWLSNFYFSPPLCFNIFLVTNGSVRDRFLPILTLVASLPAYRQRKSINCLGAPT